MTDEVEVEPRNIQSNTGTEFTAREHGRQFTVYIGADRQLWRFVTEEDRRYNQSLRMGQHTLASKPSDVANYMRAFVLPSKRRDYWIDIFDRLKD